MKSVLRYAGQVLAIVAITLALGFILTAVLFPDLKRSWAQAARPGVGFRTGTCAPGELEKVREAIFVVGDSFTEALDSSYEHSFVGLMACDGEKQSLTP